VWAAGPDAAAASATETLTRARQITKDGHVSARQEETLLALLEL